VSMKFTVMVSAFTYPKELMICADRESPADEIAVRFHHRLVLAHPFVNGNGRHARAMTDLLLRQLLDRPRFTWGSGNLIDAGDCRRGYIEALQAADRHNYEPLKKFVRS